MSILYWYSQIYSYFSILFSILAGFKKFFNIPINDFQDSVPLTRAASHAAIEI
jgi:hypothetical protein